MDPLEPPGSSSYGYEPYPCEFRHIVEELEKMSGTDVDVVIRDGMMGAEIVCMSGRLGLARAIADYQLPQKSYAVGDRDSQRFQICEERFTRGQLIPGAVWVEIGPHVLVVRRRHFPPEISDV